ncbi:hypothetical protein FA15DRAFT_653526 [Coprinopsis marcescibilis]|uniref:Uncharacterized protein n=1 Tax=Coprinopsis marcescibilis TaxID=230819 RepID=A0A5C3L491_COPMA|nr:hypothetical protein FA15DRAFT_653526 [Coprinopsis marcescibilis]
MSQTRSWMEGDVVFVLHYDSSIQELAVWFCVYLECHLKEVKPTGGDGTAPLEYAFECAQQCCGYYATPLDLNPSDRLPSNLELTEYGIHCPNSGYLPRSSEGGLTSEGSMSGIVTLLRTPIRPTAKAEGPKPSGQKRKYARLSQGDPTDPFEETLETIEALMQSKRHFKSLLHYGVSEWRFWKIFVQCIRCKDVVPTYLFPVHLCDRPGAVKRRVSSPCQEECHCKCRFVECPSDKVPEVLSEDELPALSDILNNMKSKGT